ncbi:acyl-CoA dehydrogenase [Halomicroarcula sp. F13]|uniref:Acyl-CoA dehydrogenase n=1 Tax=Haloarcula rubra TaxID=2487747 RepID=A0AAW4PX42_9EURY|nr:acyl-CoA dehydrogenase [Halomicroarcula rubra]MBX0325224.1 acyl-CoA dehydrogenase [Halomicroarcula rubra]
MSNFKSGSGNLDFGSGDDDADSDEVTNEGDESHQPSAGSQSSTADEDDSTATGTNSADAATVTSSDTEATSTEESATPEYPYFVRRSNVGDERDKRIEIHLREEVAEQEAAFRNALADELDTGEVAKTDAREFALLAAFQNPEKVAELMEDEGFGALD